MASDCGGFFREKCLLLKVWAGLGQDLRRSLMLTGEVDRESHLFLRSGPLLAKAWDENLGVKVGGLGSGGALLGPLIAKMDKKFLALTSLLFLRIFISRFLIFFRKFVGQICAKRTLNPNRS